MHRTRRAALKRAGWAIGSAQEFLKLSPEEAAFIGMKFALADELKHKREDLGLTQAGLARRLNTSQSRVAKMEAADATVSLDLLVKALLALGASRKTLARVFGSAKRTRAA